MRDQGSDGQDNDDDGPVLRLLAVDQLPAPHGPFRCDFGDKFDEQAEDAQPGRGGAQYLAYLDEMGATGRESCHYHQSDWRAIAEAAQELLAQHGSRPDTDVIGAAADALPLSTKDKRWLYSLFADPIVVGSDGTFINGQHRGCALRFSGWPVAVVSN